MSGAIPADGLPAAVCRGMLATTHVLMKRANGSMRSSALAASSAAQYSIRRTAWMEWFGMTPGERAAALAAAPSLTSELRDGA